MIKLSRYLYLLLAVVFATSLRLSAQEDRATILGRVVDATGAVVQGVQITAENAATGVKMKSSTNDQGTYIIPYLPPGHYRVTIESPGFKRVENPEIVLSMQQVARVDATLQPGAVDQQLTVTAAAPLLTTDDASLGQVVDNKNILELPVPGRNLSSLTLLGAGMAKSTNGIAGTVSGLYTHGVAMTANGLRTAANQYTVDGSNINVGFYNFPSFVPPVDAVEEFKVLAGNYSAEYGGLGGAHVDYTLRSGTNDVHGTMWEYLSNDKLDARNAFALSTPYLRQNQFGGVAAGPIIRNKTFFMVSYEGLRIHNQAIPQSTVPTAAMRTGDLSLGVTGAPPARFLDPLSGTPFPNNQIPASRISLTTQSFMAFYPLPNRVGPVNYQHLVGVPNDSDTAIVKLDQVFSNSNRFSARYVLQQSTQVSIIPAIADFGDHVPMRSQNVTLSDTHTFSPTTLLETHLSWNRNLQQDLSPRARSDYNVQQALHIDVPSSARPGAIENEIPAVGISGFAGLGDSNVEPVVQPDENYQFIGDLSLLRGKHALKAGVELLKVRSARFQGRGTNGGVSFSPTNPAGSGNAFADFLLGLPANSSLTTTPAVVDLRQFRTSFFLADTWTLTPKLTLDLGLRYEMDPSPWETHGRIPIFNFAYPGSFQVLQPGQPIFDSDYNDFAPRVGFAYRPFEKTVIRGAYGVFYSEPKLLGINVKGINPPFIVSQSFFSSATIPLQFSDPFPLGLAAAGGVAAPNSYQVNRRTPYVQERSIDVQRMLANNWLLDVGYVGNLALKMGRSVTLNVPLQPGPGAIQARRPLPNFGPAANLQYDSNSTYNALQAHIEKQFSRGFTFSSAYTFGRNIDLSGDDQNGTTVDPNNLNRDKGLSESQVKHRFTASYVWELPFGPGRALLNRGGLAGKIVGGWQFSGVIQFQSGGALTINASGDLANVGLGTRPNRICDGALANPGVNEWFNTSCFVLPAQYTFGNSGRGILIGPGTQSWDLGLDKRFQITERHFLQFRSEFFNAFNDVNLGSPDTTLGDPGFGRISSAAPARTIQLALKYGF